MPRIVNDPEIAALLAHPNGLQDVLASVLADHPTLWWGGWWSPRQIISRDPAVTLEQLRNETVAADGRNGLAQFRRALEFLAVTRRRATVNRNHSTAGWKHVAQRWHTVPEPAVPGPCWPFSGPDPYIGEGAFIAACLAAGVKVLRTEHGTYAAISNSASELPRRGSLPSNQIIFRYRRPLGRSAR